MAFQFDPNETPIDGAAAIALLVANMVSAGWAIHAYGTGSVGARVDGGIGFTAASLRDLSGSWVAVIAATGTDTVVFHRNSAGAGDNTTWTMLYAKGGLGTDGDGSTVDSESVTGDLQTIYGPGALFPADNALGACRVSCGADDASAAFYLVGWNRTTGEGRVLIFCDVLANVHASDTAPLVFYAMPGGTNPGLVAQVNNASTSPLAWHHYEVVGGAVSGASWCIGGYEASSVWGGTVPNGTALNVYDGKDTLFVPRYWSSPSAFHLKGTSTLLAWNGRALATAYTLDPTGAGDDRVVMGDLSFPWPAGVAAVV